MIGLFRVGWAIALDDGSLVFRNDDELEVD